MQKLPKPSCICSEHADLFFIAQVLFSDFSSSLFDQTGNNGVQYTKQSLTLNL